MGSIFSGRFGFFRILLVFFRIGIDFTFGFLSDWNWFFQELDQLVFSGELDVVANWNKGVKTAGQLELFSITLMIFTLNGQ